jgi:Flp pilus assembly secretin CpaC
MLMRTLRLNTSLLLSLLLCQQLPAQAQAPSQLQATTVRPDPKRAQKAAERGGKAEAAWRFDEALAAYDEAARYAPQDAAIVERGAALRSKLVRAYVEAAERAALAGHLNEATEELGTALQVDPGNTTVQERLAQLKAMEDEPRAKPKAGISGMPKLQPQPGKRNLNLRGDTKTVYEQLASLFGVKATFDPDLTPKSVHLQVDGVDFSTAMALLGSQSGTLWRPLNPTLMFIAPDTPEKRRQYALEAEQTFPLSAAVGPEDVTEMLRVLRDITGGTRIDIDTRSRTITMRDTPERLALAGELIEQLEKARGEVMLEIELLEVDRNKARALGITPPASEQLIGLNTSDLNKLKASTTLTNLLTNIQQVFAAKGFSGIPAVVPIGGGLSTFLLTLPSATANFSDSLSLVQSGRQVLLRAQDGKPASIFVGDRFPITLSLLSGSLGNGGAVSGLPGSTVFPETSIAVDPHPSALAANNFTGGSLPDLAVVFDDPNNHSFAILRNQDNGNFAQLTPSPITLGANETGQVAIGTGVFRNTNTKCPTSQPPDVVLVNSTSNNISVLLGDGDANCKPTGFFTEAPGSPIPVGTSTNLANNPSSVVVADFNGDGFLDIAVANQSDNSISLFSGNGDGTFKEFPGSPFKLTNTTTISEIAPVAMVSGNFRNKTNPINNAAEVDLAVVNQSSHNVSILLSSVDRNLNVTFTEAPNSPISVGTTPVAIATGDLSADGVPDIAVVNQGDNTVSVLLGSANLDGTFTAATGSPLPTASTPAGVVIANFANGAVPDIAVTNKGSSTLGVYLGLGKGTFASRIELTTPKGPAALIVATLTSSGLPDVALVSQDPASAAAKGEVTVIQDSKSFANSTANGIAQTPYPASEYVDLGVKIKATPTLHPNNEVTLLLEFEIRSLSGSSVNGIPIISNRTLAQTVRVKQDEPTLIGGLTDVEQTHSIIGLPGFANIPAAGYAFGGRKNSFQDTELLILVTPRKLRLADHLTRTIFAGRGEPGGRGAFGPGTLQSPGTPPQP